MTFTIVHHTEFTNMNGNLIGGTQFKIYDFTEIPLVENCLALNAT
jgi:hypothetical protein